MAPIQSEAKKAEKSYLGSAVESINPWAGSRSSTPAGQAPLAPPPRQQGQDDGSQGHTQTQTASADHTKRHLYGPSSKAYPTDCPHLNARWFYAVDAPKRTPSILKGRRKKESTKPPAQAKKFVAFSRFDSRSLENSYQKLVEESEDSRNRLPPARNGEDSRTALEGMQKVRVAVNEDFLFDVDILDRELLPVYWDGPIYDVRRGSWFFQEGNNLRPCEENLAAQLEEGYLKLKPWLSNPPVSRRSSVSRPAITPKGSVESLRAAVAAVASSVEKPASRSRSSTNQSQLQSYRLFGVYMNSLATYQDSATAWLSQDSMLSRVTSSVYERFGGGGYMSGVKLVRGYTELEKVKDEKSAKATSMSPEAGKTSKRAKRRSAPPAPGILDRSDAAHQTLDDGANLNTRKSQLQRQLSEFMDEATDSEEGSEEHIRKRQEQEMRDDYNAPAGDTQGREIEHLILVTHGIGQLLQLRKDSLSFVHDVNVLRKSLKAVYAASDDLRSLRSELGEGLGNCGVQVLPVCWRHLLDFPKSRQAKAEYDLGEMTNDEDDYPSLEDITVGMSSFVTSLVSDLALDVLLYQSAYREQISQIVLKEANRIYHLFKERNPDFKGKIHIMGHSLGSAIMFDILCRQKERGIEERLRNPLALENVTDASGKDLQDLKFDFDVGDFYCLGSPIGLFQMLKGRTIAARGVSQALPSESPLNSDINDDPFLSAPVPAGDISSITGLSSSVSSPKVAQIFNIFHPSDPISYRIEPLVSSAMSSLKPQALPYTKKGIFGNVAPQGLTGIGAMVGQSVSGLFSSLSAGITSSLLNRSLGISNEEMAKMAASTTPTQSPGAGTNITSGGVIRDAPSVVERANKRKRQLADPISGGHKSQSGNDMTLLDDELETLYSQFHRQYMENSAEDKGGSSGGDERLHEDRKTRRLRQEETKVRALNRNGRLDYCIQESVMDFNLINTLASHMSYWADEDVGHFVLSQLLANRLKR